MSNYSKLTVHPITLTIEMADWVDNCYGQRHYGVIFNDGLFFQPEEIQMAEKRLKDEDKKRKNNSL